MRAVLVTVLLLVAAPVCAQVETTPGAWAAGTPRTIADWASYASIGAEMGGEVVHDWQQPDRWAALGCDALRAGVVVGVSEILKRTVHEVRPDGSDALSWPSEHAGLAAVSVGWNYSVSLPLAFFTSYGRLAANKHHPKDVLSGLAIGVGARFVCRGGR